MKIISLAADDLEQFEGVRPSSGTPCSELKAASDAWLVVPDSFWCSAGQPGHWGALWGEQPSGNVSTHNAEGSPLKSRRCKATRNVKHGG